MSLHAVPRRIVAVAVVAVLILGQPGSVCVVHCLFGPTHWPGDHVVLADGVHSGADAPDGPETLCRPRASRLQNTAVQVVPTLPMENSVQPHAPPPRA